MIAGMPRRLRDDDGSILPLTVFFGVLALAVVLVVVAATSLYLERERLYTLADGAALAGAESFDLDDVVVDGTAPKPRLTSTEVRSAAEQYLASAASDGFDALAIEAARSPDGSSASVRLAAIWHPPMLSLFVPDGIRLRATSVARSVFLP